jgi:hypothetical protein
MKSYRILSLLSVGIVTVVVISGVATAQNPNASLPIPTKASAATEDKAIRPFHFTASKEALAAWEQPELFVGEMRAAFKSLRQ